VHVRTCMSVCIWRCVWRARTHTHTHTHAHTHTHTYTHTHTHTQKDTHIPTPTQREAKERGQVSRVAEEVTSSFPIGGFTRTASCAYPPPMVKMVHPAVRCSVLQHCSVLHRVCCSITRTASCAHPPPMVKAAVCCSVLQRCSVLQCVAVLQQEPRVLTLLSW